MKTYIILRIYSFICFFIFPLVMLIRLILGKENRTSFGQRFGLGERSLAREGEYLWVHGASIGENISVFRLIEEIMQEHSNLNLLVTSNNLSSNLFLAKYYENNPKVICKILPIDSKVFINNFFRGWKPSLCVWIESELWPNIIIEAAKRCKILLVNAKMSDKSFEKWKKFKFLLDYLLGNIELILPQTKKDFEKYNYFKINQVEYIGNIKFTAKFKFKFIEKEFLDKIAGKRVFVAASTHDPEEKFVVQLYKNLRERYSDLMLIIVPRHPSRSEKISRMIYSLNFEVSFRSKNQLNPDSIYLVDSFGELPKFYNIADVIFLGKTLGKKGGHNPLEATKLGKFLFTGPNMQNFAELTEELVKIQALKQVESWSELEKEIDARLANKERNILSNEIIEYIESESERIHAQYKEMVKKYL